MFVRLYSSHMVGDGSAPHSVLVDGVPVQLGNPYRLAICAVLPSQTFDSLINHKTRTGVAYIASETPAHDLLYADRLGNGRRIAYLTPLVEAGAFRSQLNTPLRGLTAQFREALRQRLLPEAFDVDLVSQDWPLRRMLAALLHHICRAQRAHVGGGIEGLPTSFDVLGETLDVMG